jgi:mRNA-degrading endonuclease toxin of MazEF toxin-antitoxin module
VANFDNVRAIAVTSLAEKVGALSAARVHEVKRALGHALAWLELTEI